ncbi:hypothetical protein BYT27DRAFT_7106581, partial [Phlegmacium glaucopus]
LDIALAVQLRPGLGVGADPAWMVRFLMSMFGWLRSWFRVKASFEVPSLSVEVFKLPYGTWDWLFFYCRLIVSYR